MASRLATRTAADEGACGFDDQDSVLLDGGESIRAVSERLGHADPAFTLRTYTHLLSTSESRTRDIIDAAFRAMQPRSRAPSVPRAR